MLGLATYVYVFSVSVNSLSLQIDVSLLGMNRKKHINSIWPRIWIFRRSTTIIIIFMFLWCFAVSSFLAGCFSQSGYCTFLRRSAAAADVYSSINSSASLSFRLSSFGACRLALRTCSFSLLATIPKTKQHCAMDAMPHWRWDRDNQEGVVSKKYPTASTASVVVYIVAVSQTLLWARLPLVITSLARI